MGVTISSKNRSIDMGGAGFMRLRRTIASLCPVIIERHYTYLCDFYYSITSDQRHVDAYDLETTRLYNKYRQTHGEVIKFLYAPDTEAKMSYETAKQLLTVIGDYDDDKVYGYAGRSDAAKFADFKELLRDSVESKEPFEWL